MVKEEYNRDLYLQELEENVSEREKVVEEEKITGGSKLPSDAKKLVV